MHMQVLVVGVRLNQQLLDPNVRALTELKMLKENCCIPNPVIKLDTILTKFGEGFNQYAFDKENSKYNSKI
jgi:hypothetical protein